MTAAIRPTEASWGFVPPILPPPRVPDAVREANNTEARAGSIAREIVTEVSPVALSCSANDNLTSRGKQTEFTQRVLPQLKVLHEQRAVLEASATTLQQEAAALETNVTHPTLTEAQSARQLAAAVRFSTLSPKEQLEWIGEAMQGTSPVKRDALLYEDPAITSLSAEQHARLLRIHHEALVDHAAHARLAARGELIRESRIVVDRAITAIEQASDRAVLREAKLTTLRRADFTSDAAKAEYISTHGLAAFKALPA